VSISNCPTARACRSIVFRIIDEARFDALPDSTFLTWRRRGWLGLVYAHFPSMRRWQGFAAPNLE
jgi:hypothetical protein